MLVSAISAQVPLLAQRWVLWVWRQGPQGWLARLSRALSEQPQRMALEDHHYYGVTLPLGGQARVLLLHSVQKSETVFRELGSTLATTALAWPMRVMLSFKKTGFLTASGWPATTLRLHFGSGCS